MTTPPVCALTQILRTKPPDFSHLRVLDLTQIHTYSHMCTDDMEVEVKPQGNQRDSCKGEGDGMGCVCVCSESVIDVFEDGLG